LSKVNMLFGSDPVAPLQKGERNVKTLYYIAAARQAEYHLRPDICQEHSFLGHVSRCCTFCFWNYLLRKPAGRLGWSYWCERSEFRGSGGSGKNGCKQCQVVGTMVFDLMRFPGSCTMWQLDDGGVQPPLVRSFGGSGEA
jgi:hypothetical protein